jgi:hypothetical protein
MQERSSGFGRLKSPTEQQTCEWLWETKSICQLR